MAVNPCTRALSLFSPQVHTRRPIYLGALSSPRTPPCIIHTPVARPLVPLTPWCDRRHSYQHSLARRFRSLRVGSLTISPGGGGSGDFTDRPWFSTLLVLRCLAYECAYICSSGYVLRAHERRATPVSSTFTPCDQCLLSVWSVLHVPDPCHRRHTTQSDQVRRLISDWPVAEMPGIGRERIPNALDPFIGFPDESVTANGQSEVSPDLTSWRGLCNALVLRNK